MCPFDKLLDVAEKLLGPQGCPWDQKQTFLSLQPYVLEEAHEVIEAVDTDDDRKIIEELGDLLYTIVFYAKLGEKTGRFTITDVLNAIKEKLIRRHPHVFGEVQVKNTEEIVKNWEKIKALEKKEKPSSALDGIPSTLPVLVRAQKILKKIRRTGKPLNLAKENPSETEEGIGEQMLSLILQAEENEWDAESALRRALSRLEKEFRSHETV